MVAAFHVGIILLLVQLARQDFLYRAVSWVIFPLLAGLVVAKFWYTDGEVSQLFKNVFLNGMFIAAQLTVLYLFLCIRKNAWVALTREYLGWGDILFFFTLAFFFSFLNFLLFYLISLTLLIVFALLFGWAKSGGRQIPLAGWQAACLIAVYSLDLFSQKFDAFGDEFILRLFSGAGQY